MECILLREGKTLICLYGTLKMDPLFFPAVILIKSMVSPGPLMGNTSVLRAVTIWSKYGISTQEETLRFIMVNQVQCIERLGLLKVNEWLPHTEILLCKYGSFPNFIHGNDSANEERSSRWPSIISRLCSPQTTPTSK